MNLIGTCTPNPCKHGGVCKVKGTSFDCKCKNGWKAKRCTTKGKNLDLIQRENVIKVIIFANQNRYNILQFDRCPHLSRIQMCMLYDLISS